MSESGFGSDPGTPGGVRPALTAGRGLFGRKTPTAVNPGRLPSIRSRDLTLGGVKKKTFTPNIISRKAKEDLKDDAFQKKEKKGRERENQRDGRGRGRGRPEVIQSHSIFEQGPAEMMKKKAGWDNTVDLGDLGPSHIINIKKEKRETEEETKEILRMLQKDNFLDDPGLQNDLRSTPVQLPLSQSGWLFKEESEEEDIKPPLQKPKVESMEVQFPKVKVKEEPPDEADIKSDVLSQKPGHVRKAPPVVKDIEVAELLKELSITKEEEVLFFQLPDTLPGQPPTQDTKPVKTEVQREDGQMVLLKQEKSQELVSVGVGEARKGEMIVLGHVKHRLVCSPDFESLLLQR
ncbi:DNA-directed RNA polymerase III subunit RPC4 isoform X2 [Protopterus annectens]|uniref:DNA-directed RNA polymerase III subunit RPC4 isoform X2 n=1 Tax=Protopterus annectens TaxID=7888 RepID=UPI001CFA58E0|nr:DNA-directed RNA polymerase III subunit RPC4 isoform X2 [Protopterus annectens]